MLSGVCGQILNLAFWRAIFWTLVGVGIATLLALLTLPETLARERRNNLVGVFADGTPWPLGWVVALVGLGGAACAWFSVPTRPFSVTAKIGSALSNPPSDRETAEIS